MRILALLTVSLNMLFMANHATAVNIYECLDAEGNSTFQERCPPGTTPKSEKKYSTSGATNEPENSVNVSVILYVTPECQGCNRVRKFFANRDIPVVEKNIEDNIELQDELKGKIGNLSVPTADINGEFVSGYNEDALTHIMKKYN
ncbi:MAG: glutaredoxin family protein [Thiotrichales bacterium]|nr:glutaredoxin family protein [Thiotrichales bacterium]